MRVLFLSANVGAGHVSAATAICVALEEHDPSTHTRITDSYKYAALVVSRIVAEGYLQMVTAVPQLYRYVYRQAEHATKAGPFRLWAHHFTAKNLRKFILREKPDVIVCTHAFPCGAMAEYKRMYADAPPVIGVVTDFAVHAYWLHKNITAYAVATGEMRTRMIERGIVPERIHVTGIPVHPRFARPALSRVELRERLHLPNDRNVVLIMGGGTGMGPIITILNALAKGEMPLHAVVIAGKNSTLEKRVRHAAVGLPYPVQVFRFVNNVSDYMHAADVLISKPGGLTSAEALVAGIPMVLFRPLPGQEERNARYLTEQGIATRAETVTQLPTVVDTLLNDTVLRKRVRERMCEIGKPHAADRIATVIEHLAGWKEILT